MNLQSFTWTRAPRDYSTDGDTVTVTTLPHTDLWQRTYYHFQNDNAPVFQTETDERYFSFIVKTAFEGARRRFDQCGIVMYLDSENWLKGSVEYENGTYRHLGSVVTNHGYSDWATTEIPAEVTSMWYRLSRREDDFCIECSEDGTRWKQMRICHLHKGKGRVRFGIYACSPEASSFTAVFSHMQITPCAWKAHDGQPPDEQITDDNGEDIMTDIALIPLTPDDREQFITDNQEAFNYGALEEFGRRDDHFEEDGEIISRATIEQSIDMGEAYRIMQDGEKVGGVVIRVKGDRGDLDLLFVSPKVHSKGIGYAAWRAVEKLHPEVKMWETCTPYFETRNIHFYVNRCGFHIVEFYNGHHPDPNGHNDDKDEFFRFEKVTE